jgi:putative ABC transport system substrate-binding protein
VTRTTPIVMAASSDPVLEGFAANFARPGGSITGLTIMSSELGNKRMQLLREILPRVNNPIAVLWNPASSGMQKRFEQVETAAGILKMGVESVQARNAAELDGAFNAILGKSCEGLLLLLDPMTFSQRARIVAFAAEKRLPAVYEAAEFVEAGGLFSYGPSLPDSYRRAAWYVDKILKGVNPGDLPIEQPTKFELVINMKTAKALGIKIPQSVLVQATKVIE